MVKQKEAVRTFKHSTPLILRIEVCCEDEEADNLNMQKSHFKQNKNNKTTCHLFCLYPLNSVCKCEVCRTYVNKIWGKNKTKHKLMQLEESKRNMSLSVCIICEFITTIKANNITN